MDPVIAAFLLLSFSLLVSSALDRAAKLTEIQPFANREQATSVLLEDLLVGYNPINRPCAYEDVIVVGFKITFSQLLRLHQKSQTMRTSVWLRQEWIDKKLTWNPEDYFGVDFLRIPAERIWLPDIVLYNNADGNYAIRIMTKAKVHHNGSVVWEPPAVYETMCNIDVRWFPFDEQMCNMTFGSWTYDGSEVDIQFLRRQGITHYGAGSETEIIEDGMDLGEFEKSAEWDLMRVPAKRTRFFFKCCEAPSVQITFEIHLRRKTLFYTVNLVVPCVGITFLALLVFYLPSDSQEKVALAISILISTTVYFLLLVEIIPNSSIVIPLIGKYLLFTMVMVTASIVLTVFILNVHYRSPSTHDMPPWVKKVFLQVLPRFLGMAQPGVDCRKRGTTILKNSYSAECRVMTLVQAYENPPDCLGEQIPPHIAENDESLHRKIRGWLQSLVECVCYVASYHRRLNRDEEVRSDWHYVAMVIDRVLLWIFSLASIAGTCAIFLQAPFIFDRRLAKA